MPWYRPAGLDIHLPCAVPELSSFLQQELPEDVIAFPSDAVIQSRICCITGIIGGEPRELQVWSTSSGFLLKVSGSQDVLITPRAIEFPGSKKAHEELSALDGEILLGPALILALALNNIWTLHAAAVVCNGRLLAFCGDSGKGKSTLSRYIAGEFGAWQLAADDMLPVRITSTGLEALTHFPQLKLAAESQPGLKLLESIPISGILVLEPEDAEHPEMEIVPASAAGRLLLRHTAGARLFDPALLSAHLQFCAAAAQSTRVYRLRYPQRVESLTAAGELIQALGNQLEPATAEYKRI